MNISDIILQGIAAFLGTGAFAIVLYSPRSEYLLCSCVGALSWTIYAVFMETGATMTIAVLIAAFILTVVARILSVHRKKPVTLYLITGIFSLVPGSKIYETAFYIIMDKYALAGERALETVQVAGGIVLGILFGSFIPLLKQSYFFRKKI